MRGRRAPRGGAAPRKMGLPVTVEDGGRSALAEPFPAERAGRRRGYLGRGLSLLTKERAPRGMAWPIALSILPGALIFATFFLIPLVTLIVTSFSRWGLLGFEWTGTDNYSQLIHDSVFWKAVKNTALYAAAAVFIQVPIAVIVAMILSQRIPGWRVFRTILFIPVVISGATYALIFATFYNASYGPLNRILDAIGVKGHDWLFEIPTALPAVAATYVFAIGFYMVLVMTEITAIPVEFSEAAEVDGASAFQRQFYITLPLLRHVIGTCVLLSLLSSLAFFDLVYILTSGGPADATVTLTVYAFREYTADQWGYANTIGIFIVVSGFLLILLTRRLFRLGEREL
jgi:ABC-type sugar transport system permease subunit